MANPDSSSYTNLSHVKQHLPPTNHSDKQGICVNANWFRIPPISIAFNTQIYIIPEPSWSRVQSMGAIGCHLQGVARDRGRQRRKEGKWRKERKRANPWMTIIISYIFHSFVLVVLCRWLLSFQDFFFWSDWAGRVIQRIFYSQLFNLNSSIRGKGRKETEMITIWEGSN